MQSLALQMPEPLMRESSQIAKSLHISRAAFIRNAIAEKIEHTKHQEELKGILKAFQHMKGDPVYLKEFEEWESLTNDPLPNDKDNWWQKS